MAATEEGATDYLVFGTVFETSSKPGLAVAGVAGLAAVAGATRLPVLAIGGVTAARIGEVMAAGASGVAGISMFDTPRRVP
jgi:thiamine monophosphate synthase